MAADPRLLGQYRLALGPTVNATVKTRAGIMGFSSKPVRVIEVPEPMSEPLIAPEKEPQRTEREEEAPVRTPA